MKLKERIAVIRRGYRMLAEYCPKLIRTKVIAAAAEALSAFLLLRQIREGRPRVQNEYTRAVSAAGNTLAAAQPAAVGWVITFAFLGLEVFTGIALVAVLWFLNVEKSLPEEQAEIKARHEGKDGDEA